MHYKRLIPIILVKNGLLVRSQLFEYHQAIGDPIPTIKRLSDWSVDEIILLNIGNTDELDSRRDDKWHNIGFSNFNKLVADISRFCFAPLSVGGNIRTKDQINSLFNFGADKCVLNNLLFKDPKLVKWAVNKYGSQAIVASIDIKKTSNGKTFIFIENGTVNTNISLKQGLDLVRDLKVGEVLISSIDYDGSGRGYDPQIFADIPKDFPLELIINSGAKEIEHFLKAINCSKINAAAAANIFYFTELSYPIIKNKINQQTNKLRCTDLLSETIQREPQYAQKSKNSLLRKREKGQYFDKTKFKGNLLKKITYCKKCLYPSLSASPMQFDKSGICMGCRISDKKLSTTNNQYDEKREKLNQIIKESKSYSKSDYDCIVSVSGGKDSYYQTHYVKEELKLNPLLVTYNGNNFSDEGWHNLIRMKDVFKCDHLIVNPSVEVLKKLNKISFIVMGDMNWHNHIGLYTTAPRIAVQNKIPLIFWGEHGYADLCGQFSNEDYPEMNYRERLEHHGRGFEWNFFVGIEDLESKDLTCWKYPSDKEIIDLNLRQIYLGNYIPWESNVHLKLMIEKYKFQVSYSSFERTYRTGSNLDDIHENGVHDYLKYIKFGYGRCTDHASKDIRAGILSRNEGIKLVNKMDPIKPKDLKRWLDYVDMEESEFDRIADHFRDPRVWKWSPDEKWSRIQLEE